MTTQELDIVLRSLRPASRLMYEEMARVGQPMSMPDLCAATGRRDGLTDEREILQRAGLIRRVGKGLGLNGKKAMLFVVVPLSKVDAEKERYAQRGPSKHRKRRSTGSRLNTVRSREKSGDYLTWNKAYTMVIDATMRLRAVEPMTYWDDAPEEERKDLEEDVAELAMWAIEVLISFDLRNSDDQVREKIIGLRNMTQANGCTVAEETLARRRADGLEQRLLNDG